MIQLNNNQFLSYLLKIIKPYLGSLRDLSSIIIVVTFFQLFVIKQPMPNINELLIGTFLVMLGLTFFIKGLEIGLFPIGEAMANELARKGSVFWLLVFALSLGFGTTIAEPALIAVANEAATIAAKAGVIEFNVDSKNSYALGLRVTVALAVGFAIVIGVLRILKGWPIQ